MTRGRYFNTRRDAGATALLVRSYALGGSTRVRFGNSTIGSLCVDSSPTSYRRRRRSRSLSHGQVSPQIGFETFASDASASGVVPRAPGERAIHFLHVPLNHANDGQIPTLLVTVSSSSALARLLVRILVLDRAKDARAAATAPPPTSANRPRRQSLTLKPLEHEHQREDGDGKHPQNWPPVRSLRSTGPSLGQHRRGRVVARARARDVSSRQRPARESRCDRANVDDVVRDARNHRG